MEVLFAMQCVAVWPADIPAGSPSAASLSPSPVGDPAFLYTTAMVPSLCTSANLKLPMLGWWCLLLGNESGISGMSPGLPYFDAVLNFG